MIRSIRDYLPWGVALGLIFVSRTALDWFVPTADFALRAAVTTYSVAGLLLMAGAIATWRSGSVVAGPTAAGVTGVVGAVCSAVGAVVLLGMFSGETTRAAIARSGGLAETFTLPVAIVIPGVLMGVLGGLIAASFRRRRQLARR